MEFPRKLAVTPYLFDTHPQLGLLGFTRIFPSVKQIIISTPICEAKKYEDAFVKAFEVQSSIEDVKFQPGAKTDSLKALSAYLKGPTCSITTLVVAGTKIDEEWTNLLADVLATNTSITTLKLKRNGFLSSETLDIICPLLVASTTIEELSLKGNRFTEEKLSFVLRSNTNLRKLDLRSCYIEDAGCLVIAEALKANRTLRVLDLSHNAFSAKGLAHDYMTKYEGLRCSGHEALKELLMENDVLEELFIDNCDTDFEDVHHICQALERNTNLTNIRIDRVSYSKRERKLIKQHIHRNATSKYQYYTAILLHNILRSPQALLPIEIWIESLSYAFPDIDGMAEFALSICRMYHK